MSTSDALNKVTQMLRDAVADPGSGDTLPAGPGREAAITRIAGALHARRQASRGSEH